MSKQDELLKTIEGFIFSGKDPFVIAKDIRDYIIENETKTKRGNIAAITEDTAQWIHKWIDIFPQGVESGGKLVRSDRLDCLKKMVAFRKKYPQFSVEDIFKATQRYVNKFKLKDYAFMKCAVYLIDKRGEGSELAALCEQVGIGETLTQQKEKNEEYFV